MSMIDVRIQIGEGMLFSGSGAGVYDKAIQLRVVLGSYSVRLPNAVKAKGMAVISFDWTPFEETPLHDPEYSRMLRVLVVDPVEVERLHHEFMAYRDKKVTAQDFRTYVDKLTLRYLEPEHITEMLRTTYDVGVRHGKEKLQDELCGLLGVFRQ
jgi:hypothetical protein